MFDNEQTGNSADRVPPENIPQSTLSQLKLIIESYEEQVAADPEVSQPIARGK